MAVRATWTCALGLLAGCTQTYEVEGRHVRVVADAELEMCGGTLAHMDEFLERTSGALGIPLADTPAIEFRWISPDSWRHHNYCLGAAGCAVGDGSKIFAWQMPMDHELVHAAARTLGLAHPFFLEGLAVAFEGPDESPYRRLPAGEIAEAIVQADVRLPGENYTLAGAFAARVIDRHGLGTFLELYRRSWWLDGPESIAAEYVALTGETFADAIGEFEVERRTCPMGAFRRKLVECAAPELAWDGERWAGMFTVDCAADDAIGVLGRGDAEIWRTIEVTRDGVYALQPRSEDPGARVTMLACGGCESATYVEAGGGTSFVELPAGRYAVRLSGPSDRVTRVGATLAWTAELPPPDPEDM